MNELDGGERRVRSAQQMSEMRVRQIHEWFGELDALLEGDETVKYVCVATRDNLPSLLAVTESCLLCPSNEVDW